jgi:rhodanese-related sulfurtransferase
VSPGERPPRDAASCCHEEGRAIVREYTAEELHVKLFRSTERFYLIDVLPHESYVNRHIPGAIGIPLEYLEAHAEELLPDLDVEVISYCASPR